MKNDETVFMRVGGGGGGGRSRWPYQVKDDGIVLVKVEVGWWVGGRRSW